MRYKYLLSGHAFTVDKDTFSFRVCAIDKKKIITEATLKLYEEDLAKKSEWVEKCFISNCVFLNKVK